MVMSFTYAVKTGSLKDFLTKVKTKQLGTPDKVTIAYLTSIGYKSTNDRPIIRILKSIDFLDKSGVPTQNWKNFRTEKSAQVMTSALRKTYADLFRTYPGPHKLARGKLEDFFAERRPKIKKYTLGLYVDTFKTLCGFSDLGPAPVTPTPTPPTPTPTPGRVQLPITPEGIKLDVSIRIELPVTQDADVYDKIFKSLKKHLLTPSPEED